MQTPDAVRPTHKGVSLLESMAALGEHGAVARALKAQLGAAGAANLMVVLARDAESETVRARMAADISRLIEDDEQEVGLAAVETEDLLATARHLVAEMLVAHFTTCPHCGQGLGLDLEKVLAQGLSEPAVAPAPAAPAAPLVDHDSQPGGVS